MSSSKKKSKSPTSESTPILSLTHDLLLSCIQSKKKRMKLSLEQSAESSSNPSLPDDLVVTILARVSRLYYTKLSLVSKSFCSLLASPDHYQIRTLLSRTETFLYVCLRFPDEANPRWFTLYRKPNQTTKKKKKKNLLAPTPILNSPPIELSSLIVVGSNLHAISTAVADSTCSNVWFIDCRTNTWFEDPRMRLAHHTNSKFDGNVYLAGSSETPDSLNCVQLYNTKFQTWNPVVGKAVDSICMIGNIAYRYLEPSVRFRKNNTKGTDRRTLLGLEGLPKFPRYSTLKLADYGGKLVVLWDKYVAASGYKEKMIWITEISLEKRNSEEIWGKVEWFDAVLAVPSFYKFVCAKFTTV